VWGIPFLNGVSRKVGEAGGLGEVTVKVNSLIVVPKVAGGLEVAIKRVRMTISRVFSRLVRFVPFI
jgi:hypothetical protein